VSVADRPLAQESDQHELWNSPRLSHAASPHCSTALNKGNFKRGRSSLIKLASGGVGTFAVQIARVYGRQSHLCVQHPGTGLVRSLGAMMSRLHPQDFTQVRNDTIYHRNRGDALAVRLSALF